MKLHMLQQIYFRTPLFVRLLITVCVFMFLFGVLIHLFEPAHFPSIFDGIWWAFVTGSTVGYGDYVPLSVLGKIIAILLILTGGGLVTFYMATVSASTIKHEHDLSEGAVTYKGENHIMLIGWNERTKQLLHMVEDHNVKQQFVLIDHTLTNLPYRKHNIHFVRGSAADDQILKKANVGKAKYAIITADPSKEELQADQSSILTTVAIRGNNPDIKIVTEILITEQITNATRAGADTVIRSNDFMSTLFYHEIFRTEPVRPFELLLEVLSSQQFKQFPLPAEMDGKTFLECSDFYVASEQLLIGIIREGQLKLNPPFNLDLHDHDILVVLTSLQ
ncbi:potassium channel family protein [Radiobacillus sp. PE A8.2]|uniref:potassium channel family protein n=1 Tax=Radiobacillus sp. PE A8.2 TaxID=3380349 RepID=UPI00388D412E